jgi:hypothetical protein
MAIFDGLEASPDKPTAITAGRVLPVIAVSRSR